MIVNKKQLAKDKLVMQYCKKCDKRFFAYRIKKYCSEPCRLATNKLLSQIRYDKLRRAYLESLKKQTGKEVYNK